MTVTARNGHKKVKQLARKVRVSLNQVTSDVKISDHDRIEKLPGEVRPFLWMFCDKARMIFRLD